MARGLATVIWRQRAIQQIHRTHRINGTIAAVNELRQFGAGAIAHHADFIPAIQRLSGLRTGRQLKLIFAIWILWFHELNVFFYSLGSARQEARVGLVAVFFFQLSPL